MKLDRNGMRYVRRIPKTIPQGVRLVHNFPPGDLSRPFGLGGFRFFWVKTDASRHHACSCGWAPHLKQHFTTYRDKVEIAMHLGGRPSGSRR